MAPAEDQHNVRPSGSVMVICVLLNEAAMCATPCGTTRRSRFFLNSFLRLAAAGFAGAPVSGAGLCCSFATFYSVSIRFGLAEPKRFLRIRSRQHRSKAHQSEERLLQTPLRHHRPRAGCLRETSPSCPSPSFSRRPLRAAGPFAYVRWCACAAREREDCGGGESRGTPEFRSDGGCSSESPCGDRLRRGLPARSPGGCD